MTVRGLFAIACLLTIGLAAAGHAEEKKSQWQVGKELYDQKKYKEAAAALEKAIGEGKEFQDSPDLRFLLGMAQFNAKNFKGAFQTLNEAKDLAAAQKTTLDNKVIAIVSATCQLSMEPIDFDKAYQAVKSHLSTTKDPKLMLALGAKASKASNSDLALKAFEEVARVDSKNVTAHKLAADILKSRKDIPGATKHYEAVVAAKPDDFKTLAALADIAENAGNAADAVKWAEKAVAVNPKETPLVKLVAREAFKAKNWQKAATWYGKLSDLDKKADSASFAAQAYDQLENWKSSAKFYKAAAERDASDCDTFLRLGIAQERLGEYEASKASYEKAVALCNNASATQGAKRCQERIDRQKLENE